jgi:molecular chaperone Hsp33
VDADPEGNLRGYVRAPGADLPGDPGEAARGVLGRTGYLSVIRDLGGGKFYRSAVALGGDGLVGVLRRWFAVSEQVETALDLCVAPRGDEPLGDVVGLLVQRLPDGDGEAVRALREAWAGGQPGLGPLARALTEHDPSAQELIERLAGPGFDLLADQEVAYRCGCSLARARSAVSALGVTGITEVLASEGQAEVSCEFCHAHYVLDRAALEELLARLREGEPGPASPA